MQIELCIVRRPFKRKCPCWVFLFSMKSESQIDVGTRVEIPVAVYMMSLYGLMMAWTNNALIETTAYVRSAMYRSLSVA